MLAPDGPWPVCLTVCRFFSYFTSLSYIGLLCYFWASGVQTLSFVLSGRRQYWLQQWPRPLQFLHLLLFSTISTFPVLVTVVFWALLSSPDTFSTRYSAWANISEHALNTVFAAIEILASNVAPSFPRQPGSGIGFPWIHLPFLIVLLACYLGVAYITSATQHFYSTSYLFYISLSPHANTLLSPSLSVLLPRPQHGTRQARSLHCRYWRRRSCHLPHRPLPCHASRLPRPPHRQHPSRRYTSKPRHGRKGISKGRREAKRVGRGGKPEYYYGSEGGGCLRGLWCVLVLYVCTTV